mgnify:CR=1 FL=1
MSDFTRRDAVKLVAGAPLAASMARSAFAASDQVAFALFGAGQRGQELLAHCNRIPSGRCAAICDIHAPHRDKALDITRDKAEGYGDYRQVLDRAGIGAIIVATPLHTHFPIIRDALLAGKHVFCEPPIVFKPAEIRALRALAAERSDQVVQAGFQRRYSKFYRLAQQMVSRGFLGEVTQIRAQWHRNPGWNMAPEDERGRLTNWKLYREFSGGLIAELAAHQMDVADWMLSEVPERFLGVGSLTWRRDGRDIHDNTSLIVTYPGDIRHIHTCLSTNLHLPMFGGARTEAGEMILGTEGTIEITLGTAEKPAIGLWYYEPSPATPEEAAERAEFAAAAGATMGSVREGFKGMPLLFEPDQFTGEESFFEKELKYTRRWLYSKGILTPTEDRPADEVQLDSFFTCCQEGGEPDVTLDEALDNAAAVILANLAMDERREVAFDEIEELQAGGAAAADA